MPKINVKLDEVESLFQVYPEGQYHVELTDKSKPMKKEDGFPFILWIAEIKDEEYEGKLISWRTSLAPQALWNLKNLLETINVAWDEDGFELEECFGRELVIDVTSDTYNDRPVNNIQAYYPV